MTPEQQLLELANEIPKLDRTNNWINILLIALTVCSAVTGVANFLVNNKLNRLKDKKSDLETLILKTYQSPRSLTESQKIVLLKALKPIPKEKLIIAYANLDDEGEALRIKLWMCLQRRDGHQE